MGIFKGHTKDNPLSLNVKQGGFSLTETVIALAVLAVMVAAASVLTDRILHAKKLETVAMQIREFHDAALRYTKRHAVIPEPGMPAIVTADILKDDGLYRGNGTNANAQAMCSLVVAKTVLSGSGEDLSGSVYSLVTITEGGPVLPDADLSEAVAALGASGGAVYSDNTSVIRGYHGAWQLPAADVTAANDRGLSCSGRNGAVSVSTGLLAVYTVLNEQTGAYLARYRDGDGESNTMHTDINLGGNSLTNSLNVTASGTVSGGSVAGATVHAGRFLSLGDSFTAGEACEINGSVSRTEDGSLLSCVSGTWTAVSGGSSEGTVAPGSSVPAGTLIAYGGQGTPAGGYLPCDGSLYDTGEYAALFAAIGYSYGGSGGQFRVPDMRGRFPEGAGTAGVTKEAGLPNITGTFEAIYIPGYLPAGAFTYEGSYSYTGNYHYYTDNLATHATLDASRSSPVYGNSDTVQPASVTVRFFIKT